MALLSNTTYTRISKNPEKAKLVLANDKGEVVFTGDLISLKKTKSKIKTRWGTTQSSNIFPLVYAALYFDNTQRVLSDIQPLEYTSDGWIDIEYENEE